jgi:hypothetical protein
VQDIYALKLDSEGNYVWSRSWGGSGDDYGYGIDIINSNVVYITGYFRATVDFDPGPGIDTHASNGSQDAFITKLDTNGNFQWVRTWGGSGYDQSWGVVRGDNSCIYTTGYFTDIVDFDPTDGTDYHSSNGTQDLYLLILDEDGGFVKALTWGGSGEERGYRINRDGLGNIYIGGYFEGTFDFDPGPGIYELSSVGEEDAFLCKFDSNDDLLWVRSWGGSLMDYTVCFAVNNSGVSYTTGFFRKTVDFDPGPGIDEHTSSVWADPYFLKLMPDGYW